MEVKEIPFKLNALGDDLSVTLNITARPSLTFGIFALGGIAGGVSAGLELDAPKVFTTATLVKGTFFVQTAFTRANSSCRSLKHLH